MVTLFVGVPTAAFALVYLVGHVVIGRGRFLVDDERFEGIGVADFVVIGIAVLAALLVSSIAYLAGTHLAASALARPDETTLGRSLAVGLVRQPKFVVVMLVAVIGSYLLIFGPAGVLVVSAFLSDGGTVAVYAVLAAVVFLVALLAALYLWIRLAHLPVAVAVAPRGVSAFGASWRVPTGRFWAVALRLGILYAVNLVVSGLLQTFTSLLGPSLLFSQFEVDQSGDLVIGGENVDGLSVVEFSDLLPNPVSGLLVVVLTVAIQGALSIVWVSGLATIYDDVRAPNNLRPSETPIAPSP